MLKILKVFSALASVISYLCLSACQTGVSVAPMEEDMLSKKIYLVRHAEKTKQRNDPALTPDGQLRAKALIKVLGDAGVTHIHSSDYTRTRETARPLADYLGLDIDIYDPRELSAMADTLKLTDGTHLVVGHSNTTPQLVELLGGEGGTPIIEATEYDRLYVVKISEAGEVSSQLIRYGAGQD